MASNWAVLEENGFYFVDPRLNAYEASQQVADKDVSYRGRDDHGWHAFVKKES